MAEETKLPTGESSNSYDGGTWADLDEGMGSTDDGTTMINAGTIGTPVAEGQNILITFPATVIVDADTVTRVAFNIRTRCERNSTASTFTLTYNGNSTAVTPTGTIWETFNDVNASAWNIDHTAAQIDAFGIGILTSQTGMPTDDVWELSTIDRVITYTPAPVGGSPRSFGAIFGTLLAIPGISFLAHTLGLL